MMFIQRGKPFMSELEPNINIGIAMDHFRAAVRERISGAMAK
jgi:hypothetical protein